MTTAVEPPALNREPPPLRENENTRNGPFSPTEMLVLRSVPWEAMHIDGRPRIGSQASHMRNESAKTALAVAILNLEDEGALRLDIEVEKSRFGFACKSVLKARATGAGRLRSEHGVESDVLGHVSGTPRVAVVTYRWIGEDSRSPERDVMERMMARLVGRNLVRVQLARSTFLRFFTFTTRYFVLAEGVLPLVAEIDMQTAVAPLHRCLRERPSMYRLLMSEIEEGFEERTESSG